MLCLPDKAVASERRQLLVVINPISGKGRGMAAFRNSVEPLFRACDIDVQSIGECRIRPKWPFRRYAIKNVPSVWVQWAQCMGTLGTVYGYIGHSAWVHWVQCRGTLSSV